MYTNRLLLSLHSIIALSFNPSFSILGLKLLHIAAQYFQIVANIPSSSITLLHFCFYTHSQNLQSTNTYISRIKDIFCIPRSATFLLLAIWYTLMKLVLKRIVHKSKLTIECHYLKLLCLCKTSSQSPFNFFEFVLIS